MQYTKPVTHADLAARLTRALADNPDSWIQYDLDTDFFAVHTFSDVLDLGMHVYDISYHPDRVDNIRTMINAALDAILSPVDNTGLVICIRHYANIHSLSIWMRR